MGDRLQLIAFNLPQFHPIPENDEWWGKGFTEWTNTAKAKPLFAGHYQPHVPADLGFYDLRLPEARKAQADMARAYGIEAFCYYHYWFAGKRLLERPVNEILESGEPDFPFCLCWANDTWSGIWHGTPKKILVEQTYPGYDDYKAHFDYLLKAFSDRRYLTIDGKPLFVVYQPYHMPDPKYFAELFRELAEKAGLKGLYLIAMNTPKGWVPADFGFDASIGTRLPQLRKLLWVPRRNPVKRIYHKYLNIVGKPTIHSYEKIMLEMFYESRPGAISYPCVVPNWDNTPRSGSNGLVLHGSTPELFRQHLRKAIDMVRDEHFEHKLIFIKSWNEWAEGNHLEPDLRFGTGYLDVVKEELRRCSEG